MPSFVGAPRSRRLAGIAIAAMATVAMRHADEGFRVAPAEVAVVVTFDDGYQREFKDVGCTARCLSIAAAVRDTLRQLLADFHGYATWATSGAPRDTLEFRWQNPEPPFEYDEAHLTFQVRGPSWRAPQDTAMEVFEDFDALITRAQTPDGWSPGSVRAEWAPKLKGLLSDPRIQARVFFTLPLDATVVPRPNNEYRVLVSPTQLGTTAGQDVAPRFNVQVIAKQKRSDGWTTDGVLYLSGCLVEQPRKRHYDCKPDSLQAGTRPVSRAEFGAFLDDANLTLLTVHLASFQPVPRALRAPTSSVFPQ